MKYLNALYELQVSQVSNSNESFLCSFKVQTFKSVVRERLPIAVRYPQTSDSICVPVKTFCTS